VIGSFTQFPLKLSWAITVTIHNSQGQTFDKVLTDMDRGGFADGQT
jgi:ATP-dependent DNA helicase PIF1